MAIERFEKDLNIVQTLVIPGLDTDLDVIQKLDDEPNDVGGLSPAELKAKFDEAGNLIKGYVNDTLLPAVSDTVAEHDQREAAERQRQAQEEDREAAEAGRVSAEEARVRAETLRSAAEEARVQAEEARGAAERLRALAESGRAGSEEVRVQAETARVNAEAARVAAEDLRARAEEARATAEAARVSAETERAAAETARAAEEGRQVTAETDRAGAERLRIAAEEVRGSAETARAVAEEERDAAEEARVAAETGRGLEEAARKTAEEGRVTAEEGRRSAEAGREEAEEARNLWDDYDPARAYTPGNKTAFNGSSYLCTAATTGHPPTDRAYWRLIAAKGADGQGAGDMTAAVYDPTGKARDVFAYADQSAAELVSDLPLKKLVGTAEHPIDLDTLTQVGTYYVLGSILDNGSPGVSDIGSTLQIGTPLYVYDNLHGQILQMVFLSGGILYRIRENSVWTFGEVAFLSQSVNVTLTAAGWSGSGPFTQTVSVSGLSADKNGSIGLAQSATAEQRAAARDAMISITGQTDGSLIVTADGEKPTVNLPAIVTLLG
ncbi:hypothetical protein AAEU42_13120 [Pseudoflavonifractor phocaeensis]|uniref:hypothetical protein n=1 Tax=Pseudoflavonifractor phocaeensis TaxID=1870988 RepID=UPI00313D17D3